MSEGDNQALLSLGHLSDILISIILYSYYYLSCSPAQDRTVFYRLKVCSFTIKLQGNKNKNPRSFVGLRGLVLSLKFCYLHLHPFFLDNRPSPEAFFSSPLALITLSTIIERYISCLFKYYTANIRPIIQISKFIFQSLLFQD